MSGLDPIPHLRTVRGVDINLSGTIASKFADVG
jgi:hypothetical protein